ncbi:MAG: CinA family nicotinamide mononucleotide deamidase-related protein, partial [Myxococcota bacterium]
MTRICAVCIGDELLDGRISDENAVWLAAELGKRGHMLDSVRIVPDEPQRIVDALDDASSRNDKIVVCGGLGPTADDITREAAAGWVGDVIELDEDVLEELRERFEQRGYPFTDNNRRQCTFPESADILATEVGTAAGFTLQKGGAVAFFLPGVPREFRWFCETYILPEFTDEQESVLSHKFIYFGMGESQLETRLEGIVELAESVAGRVSYRAEFPVIEVNLKATKREALDRLAEHLTDKIGPWLIAEDDASLAQRLGERLMSDDATVTVAESCTAGWLGRDLTAVAGSSGWFERGFITYSNEAKSEMLGVDEDVLATHGAVSAQTACQMAAGAREAANATYALSISGIAGPSGGTEDKPVGTVEFGLATPEGVYRKRAQFPARRRAAVREMSVYTAMALLLWLLEDKLDAHDVQGPFDRSAVWADGG